MLLLGMLTIDCLVTNVGAIRHKVSKNTFYNTLWDALWQDYYKLLIWQSRQSQLYGSLYETDNVKANEENIGVF